MTKKTNMTRRALLLLVMLSSLVVWSLWLPLEPVQEIPSRYVKINQQGQAVADWAGPWACVFDTKTGLLWEVKSDREDIHDAYWSYSWFDGVSGHKNSGDCYFEPERCDTLDLIIKVNKQGLCGQTEWRLPASHELLSLVSKDVRPGQATIAHAYFPHTKKGAYWSADAEQALSGHYKRLKQGAISVNFRDGRAVVLPYRNAAFVRLVIKDAELSY